MKATKRLTPNAQGLFFASVFAAVLFAISGLIGMMGVILIGVLALAGIIVLVLSGVPVRRSTR